MNKKLFASALFAAGAFVSTSALAALGFETSVGNTADGYLQTGNAKVAAGGSSVRANDIIINVGAAADIPASTAVAKSEIIVRLPKGLNFSDVPSYKIAQATTGGLTLKDSSEFGDPTLDDPGVTWSDANGDGGYDRAVVTVSSAGKAGDSLTISVNLTADSTATAGVKKISVVVNNSLAVPQDIVEVVSGFTEPVFSASGKKLVTVSQNALTPSVSAAVFTVTVASGTASASKLTMTPESKLTFSGNGSTITYTINTPIKKALFTAANAFAAGAGTPSLSFTVSGTATVDTQITFSVNEVATVKDIAVGTRGLMISGAAVGTAALVDVKKSGSSAALTTATKAAPNKVAEIVAGSSVQQALPTIDITENFDRDAVGATGTITLTPSAGLKFGATSSITVVGTGWTLEAPSATISATTGKLTLKLGNATGGSKTVTISGLKATASKTATGDLSLTVGSPGSPDSSTAPKDTLVVAKAVALGTVTVAGPKKLNSTGAGGATQTATITLNETTYGALSTANDTDVADAYFRLTPSAEATISAIAVSFTGYDAGTSPTISACTKETNVTTGAWICKVTGESTKVTPTTSTISLAVSYNAGLKAALGSKVSITVDGNANVSGSADIANVGITTSATKGAVPDVKPGGTEAVSFATLTITEKFAGAVTNVREFRLIAPQGVAFQDAAGIAAASAGIATATITATFNPNDTLVMTTQRTATIVVTPRGILASSATGFQPFSIVDGNLEGKNKAGITAETIMLAYGDGTLGKLDAGADGAANIGFTVQNTVKNGLNTTDYPYTVKSSDASIASPTITASVVTVTGKAAGNATITVTDGLGATDTYVVTVSQGATQPAAEKGAKASDGSTTSASFTGGATSDGGTSYATEFTTSDTVTLVGTINVDAEDQGEAGAIYVALSKKTSSGIETFYMDESGTPQPWDLTVANLGEHIVAESLAASYNVQIHNGTLAAGEYRVALAYSVGGKLIYTAKAMVITVTE
jgi:hypothetical protein